MNAKELAEATGLHENTIRNMIKRGELKAKKCGKYFVIDEKQAKDLIFSKKIETENQNKIVETYALIELLERRKKELFKEFMFSMLSCHTFPRELFDINMNIGRGKLDEEEGEKKIDAIAEYYLKQFEEHFAIDKFKEYENVLNSIEEIKKIQDSIIGKDSSTVSTVLLDIEE